MEPAEPVVAGTGRFDFEKEWTGDMVGLSRGTMLSAGDPIAGTAGYVALEVFDGEIGGRVGTVALQQFGTMTDGDQVLNYVIVPGSGTGELEGILGTLELSVADDDHNVVLRWSSS